MLKPIAIITLIVVSLCIQFPFPRAMGQTATISVQPSGTYGLVPNQYFTVDIQVSDVTDLYSWQVALFFQSSVLNATNITEGPFLKSDGASTFGTFDFNPNFNATHGRVFFGYSRIGVATGMSGSGILATVTLYTLGYGFSVLNLGSAQDDPMYYTKLVDSTPPFGNPIPHTRIDGQAYVGTTSVAIASIDTPIVIPQGMIAYINVTGQNRGDVSGPAVTFDVTLTYNGTPIDGPQTIINLPGGESQTLTFAWDILLLPLGEYNLTATATTIPGEIDFSDNTLSKLVQLGASDLAIVNLTSLKTIIGQSVPPQEYSTIINVTVKNQGEFPATSNVTAYINQTVVGTFDALTLTSGESLTVSFTWFTWNSTVPMGNYTLSAYVWPVQYEVDILNNNFTSPDSLMVGIPGDIVSQLGVEDMKDIAYVAKRFGMNPAQSTPSLPWDSNADFDNSGKVDMKDIAVVAKNFGKHNP